jgi:hypothetical protein
VALMAIHPIHQPRRFGPFGDRLHQCRSNLV